MERIINEGKEGCKNIENKGKRWQEYVLKIRGLGVDIEKINEKNEGYLRGNNDRYVLN